MIAAWITGSLNDLAGELVRVFASGSSPAIELPCPPGLVPCATCGTEQRPGAVHFASNTTIRPCAGSWRRP